MNYNAFSCILNTIQGGTSPYLWVKSVRGTKSSGRSTSAQNRPLSGIPRNSVTRTYPPSPPANNTLTVSVIGPIEKLGTTFRRSTIQNREKLLFRMWDTGARKFVEQSCEHSCLTPVAAAQTAPHLHLIISIVMRFHLHCRVVDPAVVGIDP